MENGQAHGCEILAVGGGKGGVGKSFILSSIGMSLAKKGKVIMIDADLGGANLHNFLGISRPRTSLTDFFERKVPLEELIVESGIDNLGLLSGMIGTIGAESIKHVQKQKLFTHIRKLEADYILIDLGAGAHFNTIDTLLLADRIIIVITPEIVSIENMYNFLRNLFFRRLSVVFAGHGYRELVVTTWKGRHDLGITSFRQMLEHMRKIAPELGPVIDEEIENFTVNIILNQAKTKQDIMVGNSVKSVCRKFFGINSLYTGYVEYDEIVSRSVNQRKPYMTTYPSSKCAREIERLTGNLMNGLQVKIIS